MAYIVDGISFLPYRGQVRFAVEYDGNTYTLLAGRHCANAMFTHQPSSPTCHTELINDNSIHYDQIQQSIAQVKRVVNGQRLHLSMGEGEYVTLIRNDHWL